MRYWVVKTPRSDNELSWLRKGQIVSEGTDHPLKAQRPDPGDRFFYWKTAALEVVALGEIKRIGPGTSRKITARVRAATGAFHPPLTITQLRRVRALHGLSFLGPYPATFYHVPDEAAVLLYQLCVANTPIYRNTWKDLPQASAAARKAWRVIRHTGREPSTTPPLPPKRAKDRVQLRALAIRAGQPAFRSLMLSATGGRCEITRCSVNAAIDACHIVPHSLHGEYDPTNGLVLRTDLHALLDRGLIRINPQTLRLSCDRRLQNTEYWRHDGKTLVRRLDGSRPSARALRSQWGD